MKSSLTDFKIIGDNYTTRGKNASKNFYFGKYMALVFIDAVDSIINFTWQSKWICNRCYKIRTI